MAGAMTERSQSSRASAERLLTDEEVWARPALREASLAWWTASLSGEPADYERMERADKAVNPLPEIVTSVIF